MTEKISTDYVFRRSLKNPRLSDIEMKVELRPDEIELIEQIHGLEHSEIMSHEVTRGSGPIREYVTEATVPWGCGLNGKSREELLSEIRQSRDFLSENSQDLETSSPAAIETIKEIREKIDKILETE